MRTTRLAVFVFGLLGFGLIGIALFAELIGLDKDPGWGKVRLGILILGLASLGLAYYSHSDHFHTLVTALANRSTSKTVEETQRNYWLAIPIVLVILLFYGWFVSSGRWNNWKSPTYYYDALAEAFLHGHLYLSIQPDPQLLALQNPYDPLERTGIDSPVDLSLYNGKFYMYWGPVPAIVPAVIQLISGRQMGDMVLALVFACGILLIVSLILLFIWDRYFRTLPIWTLFVPFISCGTVIPVMLLRHNYDNARIYEAAIAAGQFFLLAGFLLALTGIARERISNWHLVTAGILWALAIGSRQVLAAPIGVIVLVTAGLLLQVQMNVTTRVSKYVSLGTPFLVGFVGLIWYNWARFGSITETGFYYQLAGPNLREHYHELFSLSYTAQNLYNFLFNRIELLPKFPFVFMDKGIETPISRLYTVPEFYTAQPIAGLIYLFPFIIFALIALIKAFSYLSKNRITQEDSSGNPPLQMTWMLLSLGGTALISLFVSTLFFWVGMRYAGDFLPALTIFSCVGFWQGYQWLAHNSPAKRIYAICGMVIANATIILSTLLAISTDSRLVNYLTRIFPSLR